MKFNAGWVSILILILAIALNILLVLVETGHQIVLIIQQKVLIAKFKLKQLGWIDFGKKKSEDKKEQFDPTVNIFDMNTKPTKRQIQLIDFLVNKKEKEIFDMQKQTFN